MTQQYYKGRVEITREFLSSLLGLPNSVDADIYYCPERDAYNIMMRSVQPVSINGNQVTVEVQEGCIVPIVDGTFLNKVLIVSEDIEDIEGSILANAQKLRAKDNQ